MAVHIRRGFVLRTVGPGWYFRMPFAIDDVEKVNIKPTALNLSTQVVTTQNHVEMVLGIVAIVRVRPEKVASVIVDIDDYENFVPRTIIGVMSDCAYRREWPMDMNSLKRDALEAMRRRLGRYGVEIMDLYISDCGKCRVFRLVQSD